MLESHPVKAEGLEPSQLKTLLQPYPVFAFRNSNHSSSMELYNPEILTLHGS